MTRLTRKHCELENNELNNIYQKLCQLEDIEDELGIDLITLKKLNKIWFKWENNNQVEKLYVFSADIIRGFVYAKRNGKTFTVSTKDYGKTWALTKE